VRTKFDLVHALALALALTVLYASAHVHARVALYFWQQYALDLGSVYAALHAQKRSCHWFHDYLHLA